MDDKHMQEADISDLVVLLDEDNVEHQFIIVEVVLIKDHKYAVLQPTDSDDESAVILRFEKDEEGNDLLTSIDDDDEWAMVVASIEETLS